MNPTPRPIFNITTIIGLAGLLIIGMIVIISFDTPIYGCAIIGFTILSLFAYIIYKRIILQKEYNRAIREQEGLNNDFTVIIPNIAHLDRV